MFAAEKGHTEIVKYLISANANMEIQDKVINIISIVILLNYF